MLRVGCALYVFTTRQLKKFDACSAKRGVRGIDARIDQANGQSLSALPRLLGPAYQLVGEGPGQVCSTAAVVVVLVNEQLAVKRPHFRCGITHQGAQGDAKQCDGTSQQGIVTLAEQDIATLLKNGELSRRQSRYHDLTKCLIGLLPSQGLPPTSAISTACTTTVTIIGMC